MSAYISFYLRSEHGDYVPIGTFSRGSTMFIAAEEIVKYGQFKWITKSNLYEMIDTCDVYISNNKKDIKKYNEEIDFLATLKQPLSDILDERAGLVENIEYHQTNMSFWTKTKNVIKTYLDILDEAYDTKFEQEFPQYNQDYYLLASYETEYPTDNIVPDFPRKDFDADGFRKDFAKMINEFAGEEVLDVSPDIMRLPKEDSIPSSKGATTITTAQMNPEDVKKWDYAYEDAGFTYTKGECNIT